MVPIIEFLASPQAGWVNGLDVQVDGGYIRVADGWNAGAPLKATPRTGNAAQTASGAVLYVDAVTEQTRTSRTSRH